MNHAIIDEDKPYKVYCHRNKINGKRYIGQTKNIKHRFGKNGSGYAYNTYFWRSIQKYGWDNFEHIILKDNLTKEQADYFEKEFIRKYNTTNIEFGYNRAIGGQHEVTDAAREKMSISHKGKSPWNKGKSLSEQTKQKISNTLTGNHLSEETKQKISKSNIGKHSNKGRIPWNKGMHGEYHLEFTETHRQRLSESLKGKSKDRVWINDGKKCKFVKPSELQNYIDDNWVIGRIINRR